MSETYSIVDNNDSFLDATDMVFIDAVTTGYSRAASGENPALLYGVVPDATMFADFIYQYLTRNERWGSPRISAGRKLRDHEIGSAFEDPAKAATRFI